MIEGKVVKLQIWDTAGQERFAQVTQHYYRDADGAILVFDITCRKSFESVETWVDALENATGTNIITKLLVGNKCDLEDQRKISKAQANELAKLISAPYLETSAKDASNVDITFLNLAKKLVKERKEASAPRRSSRVSTGLVLNAQGPVKNKCCKQ